MRVIWLVFALLSTIAIAGYRITTRHVMKAHSPYAYALLINLIGAAYTLPLVWTDFSWSQMPAHWWAWLLVAAATFLWATIMVLAFSSMKHLPVSRREQISQVEVIFVLGLGALILGETLTMWKLVGGTLVVVGALIASLGTTTIYSGWRSKGVKLTVGVAALYALVAIIDKAALAHFPTGLYTFMMYLLPGAVLAVFLVRKTKREETLHLIARKRWVVLGATALSVTGYYFALRAYDLADATTVYTVLKASTVFTVAGGMLFFREERVHIWRKVISTALVVLGAVLVAGGAFV